MNFFYKRNLFATVLFCALAMAANMARATDPLSSWDEGVAKKSEQAPSNYHRRSGWPR
jgi:hypothetical protein